MVLPQHLKDKPIISQELKDNMKILVDEMPKEPYKCPYCKDKYTCTYKEEFGCHDTSRCPYFIDFKICFEDKMSEYDVRKYDIYRYG